MGGEKNGDADDTHTTTVDIDHGQQAPILAAGRNVHHENKKLHEQVIDFIENTGSIAKYCPAVRKTAHRSFLLFPPPFFLSEV